jgi:hypothetical protein
MHDGLTPAHNLTTPYEPVALYLEGADTLEYVRRDTPTVYRRVDSFLTLIFDMKDRDELVGFQLKGFKNFYLSDGVRERMGHDFMSLVGILERAITVIAPAAIDAYTMQAYERACRLALEDKVEVHDLPKVA